MASDILSIILAAGQGTRMKSDKIKVLHKVGGKPMFQHVVDSVTDFSSNIIIVVGHQGDLVRETFPDREGIKFVVQKEQLGTGHAVQQAEGYIREHRGTVLILYGDTPLLKKETIKSLVSGHQEKKAACTVLTALMENPAGYGRIIRNSNEDIERIVEEKDAGIDEKAINEINSGVCCFESSFLLEALQNLDNNNAQGEYYLTDAISYLSNKGEKVIPFLIDDSREIIGINDRINLAKAEKIIRVRINLKHMENGVTIIDPDQTYIDSEVEIGRDTIIYPFTYIEGKTRIGNNCTIYPHSRIVDAEIGDFANIYDHSIIMESSLSDNTNIGPFAYIRPGCRVAPNAKIGDFVELKNAEIGKGTKVPHLSYVGDASIGEGTNIGAGTIFANYDGKEKHRSIVGDNVFIGSNTTIVSPVKIGNEGKTGAGSVVTKDISEGTTVVGVPARVFKKKEG
ncbi:MAG: bifunctional UDP-N-acetylglucosamine diphosphorylase/glucosamine-1-phosphate N-acetyltransferase GlmU [Halanaerobiaceae bacterium]|nr:bifunctional UDP-N-acetylglucosamine diphosphorylase/glucosamine-1-phosphate N-acetyltransferase GlmU [Halanaerobiaceae bacterium]